MWHWIQVSEDTKTHQTQVENADQDKPIMKKIWPHTNNA